MSDAARPAMSVDAAAGRMRCPTPPVTSAGSAAGSCPRRWSPRSTSWTPRTARRMADEAFQAEFAALLRDYAGTPVACSTTPTRLSAKVGARILLKREDLNHTGAHKVRNVLGQALLTQRMGKPRVIAETGAGQHGVASATAAALFDLECVVYMGEVDTERQALNVARMRMLGATVVPVTTGSRTLKDAMNEAMRDWVANVDDTHYLIGTAAGPHPFPAMVRDFVRGIGVEARQQCLDLTGGLPDAVLACVGGGSNAIGIFHAFVPDADVRLYGFEAGGEGVDTGRHAASITGGVVGRAARRPHVRAAGRGRPDHRVALDLGRPGLPGRRAGARLAARHRPGDATSRSTDAEAMDAFELLCRTEGIIPAIESAHALAGAVQVAPQLAAELGRDAGHRGQPVRPRRQGRAHRRRVLRHPRRGAVETVSRDRGGLRQGPGRRAGRPGRLHAGRVPDRRGQHRRDDRMVEAGWTSIEVGIPYSDPVMDGPVIQRASDIALAGGVRTADTLRIIEAVAPTGAPVVTDDLLEPDRAVRRGRVRPGPGRRRGHRPDHPGPDPGRGRRVAGRLGRARAGPDVPGRPVVDRRPAAR